MFRCANCHEDCRDPLDGSLYSYEDILGRHPIGSFVCWMAVIGSQKLIITAASRDVSPALITEVRHVAPN